MALLISAKGSDLLAWRACGEFAATYRQLLLSRLEFCRSDEAEALLMGTEQALDERIAANDALCSRSSDLLGEVSVCFAPPRLRELTSLFFAGLYEHISTHKSAPAFYEFSARFLHVLSGSITRYARTTLGLLDQQMPPIQLIAVGPAGRQEFSPFCPLQLLLVHGETGDAEREALSQLGRLIHDGFEACGLQVDGVITPHNSNWRGSMTEWLKRLEQYLEQGGVNELIDFFRLADQTILYRDDGLHPEFTTECKRLLKDHRSAMAFQVTRVLNLSHGIGIMGGMRFERKGPFRGQFALRDNALQPLSAAISVLTLLRSLEKPSTPQRIREILWKRELNVDMAERLLQAWHTLHELRLTRECDAQSDWANEAPLYLDIETMNESEQNVLRESLETIGAIQRHIGLTFSGMEG